jgi:hypothetical protein
MEKTRPDRSLRVIGFPGDLEAAMNLAAAYAFPGAKAARRLWLVGAVEAKLGRGAALARDIGSVREALAAIAVMYGAEIDILVVDGPEGARWKLAARPFGREGAADELAEAFSRWHDRTYPDDRGQRSALEFMAAALARAIRWRAAYAAGEEDATLKGVYRD